MSETADESAMEAIEADDGPLPFWVVAAGIAIFVIAFELFNWLTGSGLFPTLGALRAALSGDPSVDISGGLWFSCIGIIWVGMIAIGRLTGIQAVRNWILWGVIALVIGGGIAMDMYLVDPALARFMTRHGYARCPAKDHDTYIGRGAHVYFYNYVRTSGNCPGSAS